MTQVVVNVNKRPYTMQCREGEEKHLEELAKMLDTEITGIRNSVGQVGDIRLLLMAGLVIADRLSEALKRLDELRGQVSDLQKAGESGKEAESKVCERLDKAAKQIEGMAGNMGKVA